MKLENVKVGDLVAVNSVPDGEVYEVNKIHKFMVHLVQYYNGQKLDSGWIDHSVLKKPTKSQLENR